MPDQNDPLQPTAPGVQRPQPALTIALATPDGAGTPEVVERSAAILAADLAAFDERVGVVVRDFACRRHIRSAQAAAGATPPTEPAPQEKLRGAFILRIFTPDDRDSGGRVQYAGIDAADLAECIGQVGALVDEFLGRRSQKLYDDAQAEAIQPAQ